MYVQCHLFIQRLAASKCTDPDLFWILSRRQDGSAGRGDTRRPMPFEENGASFVQSEGG